MRINSLCILLISSFVAMASLVRAEQPQNYKSPDDFFHVRITPAGKICPEARLAILNRAGAVLYRKDFSSSGCEHGYVIVRGEWSPDSKFFVFNVESTGGHQPGHLPVYFYSRRENKLYRLEDFIGYIVSRGFSFKTPHIIGTAKKKRPRRDERIPIKINFCPIVSQRHPRRR